MKIEQETICKTLMTSIIEKKSKAEKYDDDYAKLLSARKLRNMYAQEEK